MIEVKAIIGELVEPGPSTDSGQRHKRTSFRFAGYAAIFNRIDKGGDIIRPGAFGDMGEGQTLPLLWQHNPRQQIGWVDHVREDRRGLRVIGTLSTAMRAGRSAAAMLQSQTRSGLSFGYRVKRADGVKSRCLLALDVAEISLVSFPMQTAAKVHHVEASLGMA